METVRLGLSAAKVKADQSPKNSSALPNPATSCRSGVPKIKHTEKLINTEDPASGRWRGPADPRQAASKRQSPVAGDGGACAAA
jgi:hypothetical protein